MNNGPQKNTSSGPLIVGEGDDHARVDDGAMSFMRAHIDDWTLVYYRIPPKHFGFADLRVTVLCKCLK